MNFKKILIGTLAAAALLLASSANAQVIIGVGSSALFPSMTIAAASPDPANGFSCGPNVWTGKNGASGVVALGNDPRPGGPLAEPGSVSIVWNNAQTIVCVYFSVDSVVGQRLFFARNAAGQDGTLTVNDGGSLGQKLVTGIDDSATALPAAVKALVTGQFFTHAYTDIRPEDGQFAFFRAAAAQPGGFGYDPLVGGAYPLNGTAINSSFSATFAQVSPFNIIGTDPITGGVIPATTTVPLGGSPVIVIINTDGNLTGLNNINAKTAALVFSGRLGDPQAVFGSTLPAGTLLSEIQREPLSGTYNTFEWQLVHARDAYSSDTQEENTTAGSGLINPTPTLAACPGGGLVPPVAFVVAQLGCTNPMFINSQNNSIRYRAIGTGEMVKAVRGGLGAENTYVPAGAVPNRIGYAFYSLGTFFGGFANLQYLKLQGNDPLYANYPTGGAFGACTGHILPAPSTFLCGATVLPSFPNISNGSYRVWSNLRAIVPAGANALVGQLLQAAQDQAGWALTNPTMSGIIVPVPGTFIQAVADFVPANSAYPAANLLYFRSHYGIGTAPNPNNGTVAAYCSPDQPGVSPCGTEEGGDMAGVAYLKETDVKYNQYYGGNNFLFSAIE